VDTWTPEQLQGVGTAEELEVAWLRTDGTLSGDRTIWVVPLGGDLFVRSVNGPGSDWYRGVVKRHEGHIRAGGVDKDVTFVDETDPGVNDQIDAAYLAKYRRFGASYVDPMVAERARTSTLKLVPR